MCNILNASGEPRTASLSRNCAAVVLAMICLWPQSTQAQNLDSLAQLLASQDWHDRAYAVAAMRTVPVSSWPGAFRQDAISLLEYEVTHSTDAYVGEGYGEYLMSLSRAVLELKDPRSLRGLTLYGIDVSSDFRHFIASFGGASLPYLDEAWESGARRSGVAETWGDMLGMYGHQLSDADRREVLARIVRVADVRVFDFAAAAENSGEPGLVPLLEAAGDRVVSPYARELVDRATAELLTVREVRSTTDLQKDLSDWLATVCSSPTRRQRGTCWSLAARLRAADRLIDRNRLRPARYLLQSFSRAVDRAHRHGLFTDTERALLVGNAEYLISRL